MDNIRRRVTLSLLSSYAAQFAATATSLVTKILLAHLIAPHDLGLYAKTLLVLLGGDVLVDLGVSQHMIRERNRPYGNMLALRVCIALVIVALIEIFVGGFRSWGPEFPPVMRVMAVVILIKALSAVPALYLDRELLIQRSLLPELMRLLVTGAVSVGIAWFGHGVWALAWGTVAGEVVFATMIWRAAAGRLPIEITLRHSPSLVLGGRYLFLIALMGFALQQGHVAILGTLLTDRQLGHYTMAVTLIVLVSKVVETAVYRVIYPVLCEYRENPEVMGRAYRQATLAVYAIESPIYFYLFFNAEVVVPAVLGHRWMQAAVLIRALSIAGLMNPFSTFGYEVVKAWRKDGTLTLSMVIGAASLLTFGYVLTVRFGVYGMVAASYLVFGSIPIILSLYRTLRADLLELARGLAVTYAASFVSISAVSAALASFPAARAAVTCLLIPACWYTFYRTYGDGFGRKALSVFSATELEPSEVP